MSLSADQREAIAHVMVEAGMRRGESCIRSDRIGASADAVADLFERFEAKARREGYEHGRAEAIDDFETTEVPRLVGEARRERPEPDAVDVIGVIRDAVEKRVPGLALPAQIAWDVRAGIEQAGWALGVIEGSEATP